MRVTLPDLYCSPSAPVRQMTQERIGGRTDRKERLEGKNEEEDMCVKDTEKGLTCAATRRERSSSTAKMTWSITTTTRLIQHLPPAPHSQLASKLLLSRPHVRSNIRLISRSCPSVEKRSGFEVGLTGAGVSQLGWSETFGTDALSERACGLIKDGGMDKVLNACRGGGGAGLTCYAILER